MQRDYHSVMLENNSLHSKLENLENVFIGTTIEKHHDGSVSNSKISDTYTHSNVRQERSNNRCRVRIEIWSDR